MITIQTSNILLEILEDEFDGTRLSTEVCYDQVLQCFRVFLISANISANFNTFVEAYEYAWWIDQLMSTTTLDLN
jgi:hypothetical protein